MNNSTQRAKVIILGSGPAGLTAAIYAARANLAPILIHGPLPGGQLTTTTEVENFPGFPQGVMGPDLMRLMEEQAGRFGASIVQDVITNIDLTNRPLTAASNSCRYQGDALIIATGATPKLLGIPAEKELMGYGVSTCATCDGAFFRDRIILVVGGGDSACEEALFLSRFGSQVLMVHRRDELRASKIMRQRVLNHPKIKVLWNRVVIDIQGSKQSGVTGVILRNTTDAAQETIPCDAVFMAIGHTPNSELVRGVLECDANGYILTKPHSAATNVAGVFVCGDVQDHVYRQAITAAGSGCMAAIEAERWLECQ